MIPVPDLLFLQRPVDSDDELLDELLALAFLGRNESAEIDAARGAGSVAESTWKPELFARDVFLRDFLTSVSTIEVLGNRYRAQTEFLFRVLSQPPGDLETVRFRQQIVTELEDSDLVRGRTEKLYVDLAELLRLIRSAHTLRLVDNTPHRLAVLVHARQLIDAMTADFEPATSGLRRLHEVGTAIQGSSEYRILSDLLAYEDNLAQLTLSLRIGADGRIKKLQIQELTEDRSNRFYKRPLARWRDMINLHWRGYSIRSSELVNRVIVDTYMQIVPAISRLLALLGHLEVFLTAREFGDQARQAGLDVCLPEVRVGGALRLEGLFNPLLFEQEGPTIPCETIEAGASTITVVTGPNSGGKTRLLQGIGLAQLLGQSGIYVPARAAHLPLVSGLFASLMHLDRADQLEGRLGTELVRIRTLFQHITPRSLVMLDELCSGTNPSEAAEIVLMVLRLLGDLAPYSFITTHFLDLARDYQQQPPLERLHFLQVDVGEENRSTYQFVPGVASTSMASETARRLGVDFDKLSEQIHARLERDPRPAKRPAPA